MRALAASRYGALNELRIVDLPVPDPGPREVRIRVHATALNPADYKVLTGTMKFLHARNFPLIAGYDFSGTIEALGTDSEPWKAGDDVFGFLPYSPGNRRGAFAEFLISRTDEMALKPPGVSHIVAAAAATPGVTALQALRNLGHLPDRDGQVLVTGVSGGVGSLAVGVARRLGAGVTAVGSGRGLEIARKHGAERLIDRKTQDVRASVEGPFDVIFDAAATSRWSQWNSLIKPGGAFVSTLPSLPFAVDYLASVFTSTRARAVLVKPRAADLRLLGEWLATGLEVTLDSTIPLAEVPEGLARLQRGEVTGRVAVDVRA